MSRNDDSDGVRADTWIFGTDTWIYDIDINSPTSESKDASSPTLS